MKLQSLVVAAALAVASVAAVECTDKQIESLDAADGAAIEKACPSLFSETEDALNPTRIESLTAAALKAIEPCKQESCLTELKKFVAAAPDCSVSGLNVRATYTASVTLCEAFNAGEVTVAKATDIFKDITKNITNAVESLLGGEGSSAKESGSAGNGTELPTVTTEKPAGEETTPSTTKPATVPAPAAATPAPTTSAASASSVAGLAFFAAVTVVSSLLL